MMLLHWDGLGNASVLVDVSQKGGFWLRSADSLLWYGYGDPFLHDLDGMSVRDSPGNKEQT